MEVSFPELASMFKHALTHDAAYHFGKTEAWAFAYFVRAAEKATNTGATREALALYDQALEAADHLGDAADVTQRMGTSRAVPTSITCATNASRTRARLSMTLPSSRAQVVLTTARGCRPADQRYAQGGTGVRNGAWVRCSPGAKRRSWCGAGAVARRRPRSVR